MYELPSNGTATSDAAARSMRGCAATIRQRIYEFVLAADYCGATADEIEAALGLAGNTVRPRLVELRFGGHLIDSGRKRATRSGRLAVVWMAAKE